MREISKYKSVLIFENKKGSGHLSQLAWRASTANFCLLSKFDFATLMSYGVFFLEQVDLSVVLYTQKKSICEGSSWKIINSKGKYQN